jgi:hypothetical protein
VDISETHHNDFKAKAGKGLIFKFPEFTLGMTSDTGWFDTSVKKLYEPNYFQEEITKYFRNCDLLTPHIGSIKKKEFKWLEVEDSKKEDQHKAFRYETHLGILGLLRLIADLKQGDNKLRLVTVTEFGEEMKHMRHYLAEEMDACTDINRGTKYLPADIGLKIKLPYKEKQEWEKEFIPRLEKLEQEKRLSSQSAELQAEVIASTSASAALDVLKPKVADDVRMTEFVKVEIEKPEEPLTILPSTGPPKKLYNLESNENHSLRIRTGSISPLSYLPAHSIHCRIALPLPRHLPGRQKARLCPSFPAIPQTHPKSR